jgi:hypothetical protein
MPAPPLPLLRIPLTFERTVSVVVYAPAGTTPEQLREIGERLADEGLDGWDPDPWEASIGPSEPVEIPASERTLEAPNRYGFRKVVEGSRLGREETLVLSDAGDDLVCAEDATWWIAKEEA